jgi:hypothetical protein
VAKTRVQRCVLCIRWQTHKVHDESLERLQFRSAEEVGSCKCSFSPFAEAVYHRLLFNPKLSAHPIVGHRYNRTQQGCEEHRLERYTGLHTHVNSDPEVLILSLERRAMYCPSYDMNSDPVMREQFINNMTSRKISLK